MLTLAKVNKELAAQGVDVKVVKGKGYFYIVGPGVELLRGTMIYVFRIGHLSMEQWIESVRALLADKEF